MGQGRPNAWPKLLLKRKNVSHEIFLNISWTHDCKDTGRTKAKSEWWRIKTHRGCRAVGVERQRTLQVQTLDLKLSCWRPQDVVKY